MSATLRLAVSGLRGRSRTAAVATALVAALAAAAVVAGLSVQSQGGPQVDAVYREAGRPDLVVYGEPGVLESLRGDAAFAATAPVTPFAAADVALGDGSVESRIGTPPAEPSTVGRPLLRTGRWPAAGNTGEVVFDRAAAVEAGVQIGDRVRVTAAGRPVTLTVVGTAVDLTDCFYPDCDPIRLFVDPAALAALAPDPADRGALLIARLADPDGADAVAARLGGRAGVDGVQPWPDTRDDVLTAERIFGASLAAFGIFVLLAAAFVVAGTAAARLLSRRREIALLQAVGYTNRQIIGGLVGETLILGTAGAVAGWLAGTLVAPFLEVGIGAALDRPGTRPDPVALLVALAFVGAILTVATALPARRAARQPVSSVLRDTPPRTAAPVRVARLLERLRLGPAYRYGLGSVLARPGRSALTAAALAVAVTAVVVAAGFVSTMGRVVDEPARAGDPYDAVVDADGAPADLASTLSAMPEVAGWYTQIDRRTTLGDETFLSRAIGGDPARAGFVVREGQPLRAAGEALAGYGFLSRFGLDVGDTVHIRAGETPLTLTIVGWYAETEDTGEVLMYRAEMLPGVPPDDYLVSARPGGTPEALAATLRDRLGSGVTVRARESDPDDLGLFTTALQVMAVLVLVVSLANLAAALLSGARERARVLGVLRTVGFTVRQTLAQSATGGAALGLVAGVVGLPAGLLALRALSDRATIGIGAGPGLAESPSAVVLVATIPAAVLAGALAGALVTRRLARTPASELVRWE